ncbi:hypothetical protein SN15_14300 [Stenotrophomonas maltophilia]|nr:hypothetical protein SN15_14300 [Stenotrophomonas maltophilia]
MIMLARFSELDAKGQSAFLEALNAYLYASPQQRRRLRDAWRLHGGDAPCAGEPPCNVPPGAG